MISMRCRCVSLLLLTLLAETIFQRAFATTPPTASVQVPGPAAAAGKPAATTQSGTTPETQAGSAPQNKGASDQAPGANGEPKSAKSTENDYSKEPYVMESLHFTARFEADGRGWRELTMRARVQSESAVRELGLMVYPFASSFETLDVVYARVRKPDGTVIETPSSDVQELDSAVSRAAPMYTDEREKHVAIKALGVGDILEAKFRWTVHDAMAPGHFWFDRSYFTVGICLKEIVELDVPRDLPVKLHYTDPQPVTRDDGLRRVYTFQTAHLKKTEESKIPAWEKNFLGMPPADLRISSFTSWDEVGKWFGALEKAPSAVNPEVRAKAAELTQGKNTDDEKIRALYDFVSTHIRYIGVSLGLGRYTPHAAADVLANRYGDCKDKHTLFQALLAATGIPAYPVLISSQFRMDDSLPSASLFDHVITAIPKGDTVLFLDTTPEVAPYGLLLANLRNRQALVIPPDQSAKLILTPADPPVRSYELFRTDATIDAKGTLEAKMYMEERGDTEVLLRSAYRNTPQNQWDELTQKLMRGMQFGGTATNVTVSQPEDTSKPFTISLDYRRTDFPDWQNHRIVLPAPPFFMADLTEEQKVSKDPLPIGALMDATYESTVKLPDEYSFVPPADVHRDTDFAKFSATYTMQKFGVLHGTLELKTTLRELPAADRPKFSELATAVQETSRRYIFVKGDFPAAPALMTLSPSGVIQPTPAGLEKLEKMVADNPANQTWRLSLSSAYIEYGRAKDAVALLEEALNESPKEATALNLGLARAYLALPDADKALATYKKTLGTDSDADELNEAAYALADASVHLPEALEYAKRAVKEVSKKSVEITAEDAESADFKLMGTIATYWDTLGWTWFRMGEGSSAVRYLQAAWELSQFPMIGEHLVETYQRLNEPQKAAEICRMALAGGPDQGTKKQLVKEMEGLRRYLKAGAMPGARSSDMGGSMALSDLRTLHVPVHIKLAGNSSIAHFVVTLSNGPQGNNALFVSGAPELKNVVAELTTVKYPLIFPDDTPFRIIRKGTLSCSIYTKGCIFVLLPIGDAAVREN